jgi:hypothetical protein
VLVHPVSFVGSVNGTTGKEIRCLPKRLDDVSAYAIAG